MKFFHFFLFIEPFSQDLFHGVRSEQENIQLMYLQWIIINS